MKTKIEVVSAYRYKERGATVTEFWVMVDGQRWSNRVIGRGKLPGNRVTDAKRQVVAILDAYGESEPVPYKTQCVQPKGEV